MAQEKLNPDKPIKILIVKKENLFYCRMVYQDERLNQKPFRLLKISSTPNYLTVERVNQFQISSLSDTLYLRGNMKEYDHTECIVFESQYSTIEKFKRNEIEICEHLNRLIE